SYLFLGGKCRGCAAPISMIYPMVEALTAATFVLIFFKHASTTDFSILTVAADALFVSACIALVFIDFEHMILPNVITLPGALAAFLLRIFIPNPVGPESTFFAVQFALIIISMYLLFWALGRWGGSNVFRVIMLLLLGLLVFGVTAIVLRGID